MLRVAYVPLPIPNQKVVDNDQDLNTYPKPNDVVTKQVFRLQNLKEFLARTCNKDHRQKKKKKKKGCQSRCCWEKKKSNEEGDDIGNGKGKGKAKQKKKKGRWLLNHGQGRRGMYCEGAIF